MKSIIIVAVTLLACIGLNEALECYSHDACITNCPQLSNTKKTCLSDENKCYKGVFAGSETRGCAKDRCTVQVDGGSQLASVCCDKDLCNSAVKSKLALSTLGIVIGAFILARI